ncbi:hypothetical protein FQN52_007280 [Onygenales sp. PD_12]|nr:hypothetical protein FQN53_005392 [Emmonsiellopsis sp. PD_33]KAK2787374.1 hypothetical protein FQN52_007280 [Onygenales sp. PD_12]
MAIVAPEASKAVSATENAVETSIPSKRKVSDETTGADDASNGGLPINFTSRKPPWSYLQLELITQPTSTLPTATPLDALTARTYLTSALSQFLGVSGTSISIDILKIERTSTGQNILWIRVPRDDAAAVVTAVSSWIGSGGQTGSNVSWRIRAKGGFLGSLVGGTGKDLFAP